MGMRHIAICGMPSSTIIFHIMLSTEGFWKTSQDIKCMSWFSLQRLPETFFVLRRIKRDMIKYVYTVCLNVKYHFFLLRFKWNLNFLDRFSKNTKLSNFMKVHTVGAELFHTDRRTDTMKLIVAFRTFANANKKQRLMLVNTVCTKMWRHTTWWNLSVYLRKSIHRDYTRRLHQNFGTYLLHYTASHPSKY
jgi:hypothetical protein